MASRWHQYAHPSTQLTQRQPDHGAGGVVRGLCRLISASVATGHEIVTDAVAQVRRAGGDIAAIDGDLGAADEARLIRRKEQDKIGALLWGPLPVQRYRSARSVGESFAAAAIEAG